MSASKLLIEDCVEDGNVEAIQSLFVRLFVAEGMRAAIKEVVATLDLKEVG